MSTRFNDNDEFYSFFVLLDICPIIIGNEKLFQNGCRIRYCVARILLQNNQSFLGDTVIDALLFVEL